MSPLDQKVSILYVISLSILMSLLPFGKELILVPKVLHFVSYDKVSASYLAFTSSISSMSIPSNVSDVFNQTLWKEAMLEEMKALYKNGTLEIVLLGKRKKKL